MFCGNCGKELQKDWVKCPYCGWEKGKQQNLQSNVMLSENLKKQKKDSPKYIPIILGLGAAFVGFIIFCIIILFVIVGMSESSEENVSSETKVQTENKINLNSYEEGFAGWEKEGFPGSVVTDIVMELPSENHMEKNNYAVFVGRGEIYSAVIMQEDETKMVEWDWLTEAEYHEEQEKYYFSATLVYTGMTAGEGKLPVFYIYDPISYIPKEKGTIGSLDISFYLPGSIDTLLEDCSDLIEDEIVFSNKEETVQLTAMEKEMDSFFISEGENTPCFAGISIGEQIQMNEESALQICGYTYLESNQDTLVYGSEADGSLLTFKTADGKVTDISWVSDMMDTYYETLGESALPTLSEEMEQTAEEIGTEKEITEETSTLGETILELDYGYIYGGILDMVISEISEAGGDVSQMEYALYDMDKDGYLELFFNTGGSEAERMYLVYSTNGNVAMKLGEIPGGNTGLYECKEKNGVYSDFCHMGYEVISYIFVEHGKLKEEEFFSQESADYGYYQGEPIPEVQTPLTFYKMNEGPMGGTYVTDTPTVSGGAFGSYYLFPDSNSVYYYAQGLYDNYDYDTLRYGKNEIYARHGYIFQTEEYRLYFESMPWYEGRFTAEEFDASVFNAYEKHNIQVMQEVLDFYEQ